MLPKYSGKNEVEICTSVRKSPGKNRGYPVSGSVEIITKFER
jgi:hypothetical protein